MRKGQAGSCPSGSLKWGGRGGRLGSACSDRIYTRWWSTFPFMLTVAEMLRHLLKSLVELSQNVRQWGDAVPCGTLYSLFLFLSLFSFFVPSCAP